MPPEALQFVARRRRARSAGRCCAIRASRAWCSRARPRRRGSSSARWPRAPAPIGTLIAETGGLNVMIADSSALPEQVVLDAVQSGVQQRRPALLGAARAAACRRTSRRRVLSLAGAAAWTSSCSAIPRCSATDVGPVIDADALAMLERMPRRSRTSARWSHRAPRRRARARPLLRAAGRRDRLARAAAARGVRPGAARRALPRARSRRASSTRSMRWATGSRSASTRASTALAQRIARARASATSTSTAT